MAQPQTDHYFVPAQSKAPKEAKVLSKPFHLKDLVVEIERVIAAA